MLTRWLYPLLALVAVGMLAVPARADLEAGQSLTLSFIDIDPSSSYNAADAAAGEADLSVVITDATTDDSDPKVSFDFQNAGTAETNASSATGIAFDESSSLLTDPVWSGSSGVLFIEKDKWVLPAGENLNPPFNTTFGFDPNINDGIQAGEYLNITFSGDYSTVVNDINSSVESLTPSFRIGILVQNLPNGGSQSFATPTPPTPYTPGSPTPVPNAVLLGLLGLGFVGLLVRRMR